SLYLFLLGNHQAVNAGIGAISQPLSFQIIVCRLYIKYQSHITYNIPDAIDTDIGITLLDILCYRIRIGVTVLPLFAPFKASLLNTLFKKRPYIGQFLYPCFTKL